MISIGNKIGKLIVLEKDIMTDFGQKWLCQCDCGNLTSVREDNLINGMLGAKGGTRSCGCLNPIKSHCRGIKRIDRIGDIVNNYQYILRLMPDSNRSYNYLFYDLINEMWRTSDPRHVKDLAHNSRFEYETSKEALHKYYTKLAEKSFSAYKDENNIMTMLFQNNFIWTKQFSFEDCKDKIPLPFDIAIFNEDFNLSYLIEYDGEQHFHDCGMFDYDITHNHDIIKNKYCFDNDVPLIRIPYNVEYTIDDLRLETTRFLLTPENEEKYYTDRRKGDKNENRIESKL